LVESRASLPVEHGKIYLLVKYSLFSSEAESFIEEAKHAGSEVPLTSKEGEVIIKALL